MRGRAPSREPARPLKLPQPGPLRKYGAYVRLGHGDNMRYHGTFCGRHGWYEMTENMTWLRRTVMAWFK